MALKLPSMLKLVYAGSRREIVAAASFSFALNLLSLTMPLFTIQLYNRVLLSGSGATLVVITVAALSALGVAALLEDMVVAPPARGKGVGSLLLQHAIAQAKAQGCKRVTLLTDGDNEEAKRFYQAQGFVPVARFVEVFADPRAAGLLPADSGALHPLIVD